MSTNRTEVERKKDQAQRDRAKVAQIDSDRRDDLPSTDSLFQPPSKVSEEQSVENDNTTNRIESLFGRWDDYKWDGGIPMINPDASSSTHRRSPASQGKTTASNSSTQAARVNGEHKHQSYSRASSRPADLKHNKNHAQMTTSRHGNDSSHRRENKMGSQEQIPSSSSTSLSHSTNSHSLKTARSSSQSRNSYQPSSHSSSPSTKIKHSSVYHPDSMTVKKESSPALLFSEHHSSKDLVGSSKSGSDNSSSRLSGSSRSRVSDIGRSYGVRGPSTPPFPPPSQHTPHRTPPPQQTPPPHRTPPPPYRTPPPPPHRTPPPHHVPHSQNATIDTRSQQETKPNLTLNIKQEKKSGGGDLENIFKEMEASVPTPVTALSETPVKCPRFQFIAKDDDIKPKPLLSPLTEADNPKHRPEVQSSLPPPSQQPPAKEGSSLELEVSDDSDDEREEKAKEANGGKTEVKEAAAVKKDGARSSSDESSSDGSSDTSSGPSSSESEEENEEETAESAEQKPSGNWGLLQFIKKSSPRSAPSSQPIGEVSNSKVVADSDLTAKVKVPSPRKIGDIGPCNTMPFIAHEEDPHIPRNNEKASLSPDTVSTASSHSSVLDNSKKVKGVTSRRDSAGDLSTGNKDAAAKQPAIRSGPGRPKSSFSSRKASGSGAENAGNIKVVASGAESSKPQEPVRKRRKTSSSGAEVKAAKISPPATTSSSSSEVDVESVTPPDTKQSSVKPSSADPVQQHLAGDVSKHLFQGFSSAAATLTASADSKQHVTSSKAKSVSHRDSSHSSNKSTRKSPSASQGSNSSVGSKSGNKAANGTLTDIHNIMRDIEVRPLLSPTIRTEPLKPEPAPLHVPTLTCGKPSIVVRLSSIHLSRLPQPRPKDGRSTKGRQETSAQPAGGYPHPGSGSAHKGAPSNTSASSKAVPEGKKSGNSGGGKKQASEPGSAVLSSLLPSSFTTSVLANSLTTKRKKDKDSSSSSSKKPRSAPVASKPSDAKAATVEADINGVTHPEEAKKAGSKRVRRGSASSSSSRSSHSSRAKKAKQDLPSSQDQDKGGGSTEVKVNGKDDTLPFNSYSQSSGQHHPSPKPASTPSPRVLAAEEDYRILGNAEHRLETQEFYMQRAKQLKHEADKLTEKPVKLLPYVKSILYFILWGHAYEKQTTHPVEPQRAFSIFSDTSSLHQHVNRIRHAVLQDSAPTDRHKKLSVLILRIQSLLCLKLYSFKKAETLKLKKVLENDFNKSSSMKVSAHAPSPHQNHWKNSTGTPSPMSPTPSPNCSIGSVESQGSCEQSGCKPLTNGTINNSTIAISQRVHSVMQRYMQHTGNLLQSHDLWDQSDTEVRTHNLQDFFKNLDNRYGPLSLHSNVVHLVTYVNAALKEMESASS